MVGKWKEAVLFSNKEGSKKGSTETCLTVSFENDGAGVELVQGLYHAGLLEEPLAKLVNDLKQHFLDPLLTKNCKLRMSEDSLTLNHLNSSTNRSDPCLVFSQLRELLSFLSVRLDCALDPTSTSTDLSTLFSAISPLLAPWLCDQLVRHVLAPGYLVLRFAYLSVKSRTSHISLYFIMSLRCRESMSSLRNTEEDNPQLFLRAQNIWRAMKK